MKYPPEQKSVVKSVVLTIRTLQYRGLLLVVWCSFFFAFQTSGQLSFTSPVLELSVDLQVDAVYRFATITTGVDALISIVSRSDVQIVVENIIDSSGLGSNEAWLLVVE